MFHALFKYRPNIIRVRLGSEFFVCQLPHNPFADVCSHNVIKVSNRGRSRNVPRQDFGVRFVHRLPIRANKLISLPQRI